MTAKLIQVIETNLTLRGTGETEEDRIRIVRQYWSLDGKFLAEADDCRDATFTKTPTNVKTPGKPPRSYPAKWDPR